MSITHSHNISNSSVCCVHHSDENHCHHCHHSHGKFPFTAEILTSVLFATALAASYFQLFQYAASSIGTSENIVKCIVFLIILLPVGIPICKETIELWGRHDILNEFSLMLAATIGAFALGEFPEGVAILLFYSFGEKLEGKASAKARERIKKLFGHLPDTVKVVKNNQTIDLKAENVEVGSLIFVRPGERVPIDSILEKDADVAFDASAITGESVPVVIGLKEEVSAGLIPLEKAVTLTTIRKFSDSSFTRILGMIEQAVENKSPTESMLRRITRWYTPLVFILAILLCAIPAVVALFNHGFEYHFSEWFQRSLVFLVCSCPCALVVSIPLSYFSGIGVASSQGLLFKGAKYIDLISKIKTVVFDKTGTLTTGEFHIEEITSASDWTADQILSMAASIDKNSAHPLAKAIVKENNLKHLPLLQTENVVTVGHGMSGEIDGKQIILGSTSLLERYKINHPIHTFNTSEICLAVDGKYAGSIFLTDSIKEEAYETVANLRKKGVRHIEILSGDRPEPVERIARQIGADKWQASMLPADKPQRVAKLEKEGSPVMFIGDGVNDAPSLATSTIGVAMGTKGSDIAMECAQVVIAGDNLSKITDAFSISSQIRSVVTENLLFAFGVKGLILLLGALGVATLWGAVFADTGVTLCTVAWTLWRLRKVND